MKQLSKSSFIIVGLLQVVFSFSSCGFAYQKHIVGRYYIIGVDDATNLSLSYKLNSGDFVGRVPSNTRIIECVYNDTFLVAKVQKYDKNHPTFYIINMIRDSELAEERAFRTGPITESDFNTTWKPKFLIQMTKVK